MGEHRCALDDKGRLNFPAKFREEMGDSFVITRWLDNCVVAFPQSEWSHMEGRLRELSVVKSRNFLRFLYSGANEAAPDKQGRILIPPVLRRHAGLDKDVVVIGVGKYAEIWSEDGWASMEDELDSGAIENVMEELGF